MSDEMMMADPFDGDESPFYLDPMEREMEAASRLALLYPSDINPWL